MLADQHLATAGRPLRPQRLADAAFSALAARPDAVTVRDAGLTEVAAGSQTVVVVAT